MKRARILGSGFFAGIVGLAALASAQTSFVTFESGPVRPLALTPDASRLLALNTPDARLEVFDLDVGGGALVRVASVPVGLEPVAVAARTNDEVWVVNHLSDSVSIVDLSAATPRVVRTLLVGDEPRDVVFAGTGGNRAFITTAHRGQHRVHASIAGVPGAGDPALTTPGVGRADVWVFDAANLGSPLGGTPITIVELFADTPRALAVSPDGGVVYAAAFHSGNQTTTVSEGAVCDGFQPLVGCNVKGVVMPGGNPGPATNHQGEEAPEVGLIVKFDAQSGEWRDELGRSWNPAVRFDLPDRDVFAINAETLEVIASHSGVGTILFNMAINPANGALYVSNTEARNEVRFEGPGSFGGSTVQGRLAEARVTVVADPGSEGSSVVPRHLNEHIDYTLRPAPAGTADHSLSMPLDLAFDATGETLFLAAFGSSAVGVFDAASLEDGSFDPVTQSAHYIDVTGGGPAGLALDEPRGRLYVLTRFDNSVVWIDLALRRQVGRIPLHNPEPRHVVEGRPFLYDALATSSNGEASCASCHVFGDMDDLAWDLGNPDDEVTGNPIPIKLELTVLVDPPDPPINGTGVVDEFHPMKGPMTTQTLRGLAHSGAMHWRGDRANGFFGEDEFDEELSFKNFIVAFEGLLGRDGALSEPEMQKFTDFALDITLPPNPVRALDNRLSTAELRGADFFLGDDGFDSGGGHRADGVPFIEGLGFTCEGCHILEPQNGFFGTDGEASFEEESQILKVPHLRNLYQKVGMFGMPNVSFFEGGDNGHKGEQIRGFGFLHDGSVDTLFRFLRADVFSGQEILGATVVGFEDDGQRRDVERFLLAFNSDLAPIVGQQVTLDAQNAADVGPRIDLLIARAAVPFASALLGPGARECDLVVQGTLAGDARGWLFVPASGAFVGDGGDEPGRTDAELRALATSDGPLTYSCVPWGSGQRMARDRDEDAVLNAMDTCPGAANAPGAGTCTAGDALRLGAKCTLAAECGASGVCSTSQTDDVNANGIVDACDPVLLPEPAGGVPLLLAIGMLRRLCRRRKAARRVATCDGTSRQSAADSTNLAAAGYRRGVPMGGELGDVRRDRSPRFAVLAEQDAGGSGTPLQRIQILKGWLDGSGEAQEALYDVAGEAQEAVYDDSRFWTVCSSAG